MNIQLIFELIDFALGIIKSHVKGGIATGDITVAQSLLKIINSAKKAYEDHTGQPLDVSLISEESPIN